MKLIGLLSLVLLQPTASLRATVEQAPTASDGTVTLTVRLEPTGLTLGAYQGALRFAPGALRIVRTAVPPGDGSRLVNVADSTAGVIRFAGFAVGGFQRTEVLTVVVRPLRPLARAEVRAQLDVASDVTGRALEKRQLLPSEGLRVGRERTP